MKQANIQSAIDAVESDYFYSMRTLQDRIDRDEWVERLEATKARQERVNKSREDAIAARRREMRR